MFNKKIPTWLSIIVIVAASAIVATLILKCTYFIQSENPQIKTIYTKVNEKGLNLLDQSQFLSKSTKGVMIMIEFHEDVTGLTNFVDMLSKNNIPGVLLVSPNYIKENPEELKEIEKYNIKIAVAESSEPFWGMPYKEQLERMKEAKNIYEEHFDNEMEIFTSRYFAYDENTVKAAEELGIDYVFARGTTGNRATTYKPKEYDVKIFSVSNINSPKYGTGSLCDYSYWARAGVPEDFEEKLFDSLKYDQISPASHTYLGGMKKEWNAVYSKFLNQADVNWKTFDEIVATPDLILSFSEIPQNREVQYVEPKPNQPLEDSENVDNPCRIEDLSNKEDKSETNYVGDKIVMFHNNQGPMCKEAKQFFDNQGYEIEEHITGEEGFREKLNDLKNVYKESEGVSNSFGYYPVIFVEDKSFSGFNEEVKGKIKKIVE